MNQEYPYTIAGIEENLNERGYDFGPGNVYNWMRKLKLEERGLAILERDHPSAPYQYKGETRTQTKIFKISEQGKNEIIEVAKKKWEQKQEIIARNKRKAEKRLAREQKQEETFTQCETIGAGDFEYNPNTRMVTIRKKYSISIQELMAYCEKVDLWTTKIRRIQDRCDSLIDDMQNENLGKGDLNYVVGFFEKRLRERMG